MAHRQTIELAYLAATDNDAAALASPAVGAFTARVAPGHLVQPGETIGVLEVLNQVIALRHPRAAGACRIARVLTQTRAQPVGYGEPLIRLAPIGLADGETPTIAEAPKADGLPADARSVDAPVDGQFYRRPSPDEPPFASVGDTIAPGAVVGLIEVMKFFYEVSFEHDGGGTWRVERVVADDGTALSAGDPILWLVPAD